MLSGQDRRGCKPRALCRSPLGKRVPRALEPESWVRGSPGPPAGLLCPGISRSPSLSGQLVGTEDVLLQQLAEAMLKEDCTSELKV